MGRIRSFFMGRFSILFLKFKIAKEIRLMKVGSGQINRSPGEPVRVGRIIRTFIQVCPPDAARFGEGEIPVGAKNGKGDPVFHAPGGFLFDLRIYNPGQTMSYLHLFNILFSNGYLIGPRQDLMMEEHGPPAIHFQVKIALGAILFRTEKEFHATVCIDRILVLGVY
jgi:hypothetical protein